MEKEIQRKTIFRLWDLIELGVSLRRMHHAQEDWPTRESDTFAGLEPFAIECLNEFVTLLKEISVKDTKGRLSRCLLELEKLLRKWDKDGSKNVDGDTDALLAIATEIEPLLTAVAANYIAFIPTELGTDARRYIDEIETFIGPEVFGQLPKKAQVDWQQAGKCLAFEAYTGAVCLMFRATEAALRCYYCALTDQEFPEGEVWTWVQIVNRIRGKINKKEVPVKLEEVQQLHDFLESLGSRLRNPTMHPQEDYDLGKARYALENCGMAIQRMAKVLKDAKGKTFLDGWDKASKTMQSKN